MSYSECLQCQFYVSPHELRCPNCGLLEPLKKVESESISHASASSVDILIAVAAILGSLILGIAFSETMPGFC